MFKKSKHNDHKILTPTINTLSVSIKFPLFLTQKIKFIKSDRGSFALHFNKPLKHSNQHTNRFIHTKKHFFLKKAFHLIYKNVNHLMHPTTFGQVQKLSRVWMWLIYRFFWILLPENTITTGQIGKKAVSNHLSKTPVP